MFIIFAGYYVFPHGEKVKSMESWIWDAACSIRGAADAAKYKDYILPLIFIKRWKRKWLCVPSRNMRRFKCTGRKEFIASTWAMSKMNMVIHDMEGKIEIGDSMRNPAFREGGKLIRNLFYRSFGSFLRLRERALTPSTENSGAR